jgi:hypothetical protein
MRDRLLTRHFLQRFLENDLLSPDADRRESIAVIGTSLVSGGLVATMLFALKYLTDPFPSPGRTLVVVLDDRFFYFACSMTIMALMAVAQWDALALDARDTAVLGPLPVPRSAIVRAKLAAVVLFAVGFAVVLNLAPSVLHPAAVIAQLPIGLFAPLLLIAAHAAVTLLAGAFGFLSVLAVRECLRVVLGGEWFRRGSTIIQAALVVLLVTALLMIPTAIGNVARGWLAPRGATVYLVPPLWFVGLHEMIAGGLIDGLPRDDLPLASADDRATQLYRSLTPLFHELSEGALIAFGGVAFVTLALYTWNNRRLPAPAAVRPVAQSARRALMRRAVEHLVARQPLVRAGFYFTLQTLFRSGAHRLSLAAAGAVGLASIAINIRGLAASAAGTSIPVAWLAVQTLLLVPLLVGVRHAARMPAYLPAGWLFQLAWRGDERPYLAGVRRAAFVGVSVPVLLALVLPHALVLGPRIAGLHLLFGIVIALILIDLLLLGVRTLPFVSSYEPPTNMKFVLPMGIILFFAFSYGLAAIERAALRSPDGMAVLLGVFVLVFAALRAADVWQRRTRIPIEWTEMPASAAQRFNLSA